MLRLIVLVAFVANLNSALTEYTTSECEPKIKCGPNQVYEECPSTCPPRTCATKDIAFRCKEPLKPGDPDCPPPGCRCVEGYYSNDVGACVLKKDCPKPKCKANEELSECPNKVCREQTCDNLGFELPCYQADQNTTECGSPRCICIKGYVRNKNGICIRKENCPSCGGDSNAVAGCGTFCNRCTGKVPFPKICQFNGCECRNGFVYDDTKNKCVLPTQCPVTCKQNEQYEECPNRVCRAKTCNDLGYPLACYQSDLQNVSCGKPACICQDGYVKDKNGVCISNRECPSCGGDRNAWSGCGTYCTRCSNYKRKNFACILLCLLNSCDCRPGYVYDEIKKKCVLPEQCPCGPNEVRSECIDDSCLIEKCSQKDLNIKCKPNKQKCKPGCLCAEGYLRDDDGVCVPRDQCPQKCGPYEVYSSCANAGCGRRNCTQLTEPELCIDVLPSECRGGCICESGYLRNSAGQCVPVSECTSKEICPKPHEYYEKCPPDNCPPRSCDTRDIRTLVPCRSPSNPDDCRPSCVCEEGYYRNSNGDCVTLEECPPLCGANEVASDCATNICLPDCSEPERNLYCKPNPANCKPGCVCADGYLRNKNGFCVLKKNCPPNGVCSDKEEYSDCANKICVPTRCDELGLPLSCDDPRTNNTTCIPGCICKLGTLRNKDGVCINGDECPSCGGDPNARRGCGSFCIRCGNYNKQNKTCPIGCILNGCKCRDNYIYDEVTRKCILPENCPLQCGPNEVPSNCGNNGCLSTCARPDFTNYCDFNVAECKPGCICEDGYLRDENGVCIAKDQCPSPPQCGPNEVSSGCANDICIPDCSQPDRKPDCNGTRVPCERGCICADGYLRNKDGVCVLKEKCPPNVVCCDTEEYSDCPNKLCLPKRCDELGFPLHCDATSKNNTSCTPGCICKSGLLRNKHGVCVNSDECPSCGGDPNAKRGCGSFCTRCSNYKIQKRVCPIGCILNGCACRDNYVYDEVSKKCVLPENCPPQCGPNEVASDCATNICIPDCSKPDRNLYCKPNPANCKPGCICADGYLRNKNGVCVRKDKCPPNVICSDKEEYSDCPNKLCLLKRCDELGFPLPCDVTSRNNTLCTPGCICKSGLLRNKHGVCVNVDECPSCGGDPNATLGCGSFCTRCSNYKLKKKDCPLGCILNGCACRDNYVYDEVSKKCVLPENCPLQCGPNEVPSNCGNNGCLSTCAQPDLIERCDYNPDACKPGCVCADGYLKNEKGVCVPKDQCPPINDNKFCLLAPETGPCRASMPKYYYDSSKKDCVLFIYGGCQGNDNKFDTKEECLNKCSCYNK